MIEAMENFKALVASTSQWQSIAGVGSAEAALASIYLFGRKSSPSLPAMFVRSTGYEVRNEAQGVNVDSGSLGVRVELPRPEASDYDEEYALVMETATELMRAIADGAQADSSPLEIRLIRITGAPVLDLEKRERPHWAVGMVVEWPGVS